jgi:hypothetical protein
MWGLAIAVGLWIVCTIGVLFIFDAGKKQDRRFKQAMHLRKNHGLPRGSGE